MFLCGKVQEWQVKNASVVSYSLCIHFAFDRGMTYYGEEGERGVGSVLSQLSMLKLCSPLANHTNVTLS